MENILSKELLSFQKYELDIILKSLEESHYKEISNNGKWEVQDYGQYYYSSTKHSKRIKFIINSIKRQIEKETDE